MAKIHFILQGKGGIGKSVIASLMFQYITSKNVPVRAYDTDPVNHSLASYKEFNVTVLDIMDGSNIDKYKFDDIFNAEIAEDEHLIIDNGASSFVAFKSYISESTILQDLKAEGHEPIIHTVVVGGDALQHTLSGFKQLVELLPENIDFMVWLNTFFQKIQHDGKQYHEFDVFQKYGERVSQFIELPYVDPQTLGRDLATLFANKKSLEAAIMSDQTKRMTRSRLKRYRDELFSLLDMSPIV